MTAMLMVLRSVSVPFNADTMAELKFSVEGPWGVTGELYLRVTPEEAKQWRVGDMYGSRLQRL